ncbi:MAG: site-specific integrase, partial [Christensenellaceae bacterium]
SNIIDFRNQQKKIGVVLTENDTLSGLSDLWLESKYPQGSTSDAEYNTYQMYYNIVKNHIKTTDASHEIAAKITTADLQRLINSIVKAGHNRTADLTKNTLIQIFRLGVDWNKLLFNPAEKIILKKHKCPPKRTTTELEETAILKADFTPKERAFLYLELFAGLRKGESLALLFRGNKSDIDFKNNVVTVNKTLIIKDNVGMVKNTPKSDSGNRTNPIVSLLRAALMDYIATSNHESDYLFETQAGGLTTRSSYRKMWDSVMRKLNAAVATADNPEPITDLTSHILRHTFATYLAVVGVNPQTVQRLLGHGSIQMTMDVYTHLPLYHRYEKSPIFHFYKEYLVSQKSVKTINRQIRTIKKN